MILLELEQNSKTKAIVICPYQMHDNKRLSPESRLQEAVCLSLAINIDVVYSKLVLIREIKPATYFSKGIIDDLMPIITENDVFLMIVDTDLSPVQQRNLEKTLHIKVIDRTALILEIFGERAATNEGKLQVELAHLTYQRSRLVRSWTHLERQRGGAGFLGGPGEKQIELDKRIIDDKIVKIKKELEKVKNTRALQRQNRKKVPYPIVALAGYTNAGKSSLFNLLTKDKTMVADMLFATLDPLLRKIKLPNGLEVIVSDTVGFISNLPHELVMAFRSTLEEVLQADIIIHVRDISNPDTEVQRKDVLDVLHHLGLKNIENEENYIEVLNKTDLLGQTDRRALSQKISRRKNRLIAMSALNGDGKESLLKLIEQKLNKAKKTYSVHLAFDDGKAISLIYQYADVIKQDPQDDQIFLNFNCDEKSIEKLKKLLPETTIKEETTNANL